MIGPAIILAAIFGAYGTGGGDCRRLCSLRLGRAALASFHVERTDAAARRAYLGGSPVSLFVFLCGAWGFTVCAAAWEHRKMSRQAAKTTRGRLLAQTARRVA